MPQDNVVAKLTLPEQLRWWGKQRPHAIALTEKAFGIWQTVTWAQYEQSARHFGLGLASLGLAAGEMSAVLAENCKEWVFAQLGHGMIGAVTVGIYSTSPAEEVHYLLEASDARVVICEDQEQLDKVLAVKNRLPKLAVLVVIDPKGLRHYRVEELYTFEDVMRRGAAFETEQPKMIDERLARQTPDDVALMIFTSGSTGRPKAAMISYANIQAMAVASDSVFRCTAADAFLSYLPLCHVAEQIFTVYLPLLSGAVVNFAESQRTLQADLREIAPSIFLGVPRIWEKMHAAMEIKIRDAGGYRRRLYEAVLAGVAKFAASPRATWSLRQRLIYFVSYWTLLRSLNNFLGLRECRMAISGAAPISPQLLNFFRCLGVPLHEVFGMTETAGIVTVQHSASSPAGTVGAPVPGIEVKLADDGELLVRGPTVFRGYYKNEAATHAAIDAKGWLHTGDVACWQGDELKIVDRKKDVMITAGGKNISPSEIENALKFSPFIREAVIVADRRHFVTALIQVDADTVGKWLEEANIAYTHFRSLAEHPQVRELIQSEVDRINSRMPQVQQVRKFHLLAKELDHDDGEVTATMKVKRQAISDKYADAIEAMYR